MTPSAIGAVLGASVAGGVIVAVRAAPPFRRPRLDSRLAPYVSDTARPSRLIGEARVVTPFPTLERLLRPVLADAVRLIERVLGGSGSVRRRIEQAGLHTTVEEFRVEQVIWGAAGLLAGVVLMLVLIARSAHPSPLPLLLLCLIAAASGVLGRDRWLSHQVHERGERMTAEFPTVAELLALAVSAGESPIGALERVTRLSRGELARELGRALDDARGGAPLVAALDAVAARTTLPALARFVDGIAVAVERGTPLAEVLRAQAVDVRESGKRALMDASGKKEIAMMVPVVFLILPVTVLFLLFPGLYGLSFSVP
jgi:tight adherence protein C